MEDFADYLKRLHGGDRQVNPFLSFMAMTLEELREGYARFRMPVRAECMQGSGLLQGGLMVAMADETIAHAVMTLLKTNEGLTTIELKSNFLAPVKAGDIVAEAHVFKRGKTLIIGDCLINDGQGRSLVRCSATFMVIRDRNNGTGG